MSLLQRLKAGQQGDQGGGGAPPLSPPATTGAQGGGGESGVPDPRRPSMKTLAVPSQGQGRRPSGPRTNSISSGGRPSMSSGGRPSMSSGGRPSQSERGRPSLAGGALGASGSRGMGPSLMGLLASKRLAKRFASRFHNRHAGPRAVPVQKEPSYRMEPHCKFNPEKVETMLKTLLEDKVSKMRYSPKICPNMCKILGDEIKQRVKHMNFDRYKIVANVTIGQNKNQGMVHCSRCAWDDSLDNYASYTFQNDYIFCTATVFAIYSE